MALATKSELHRLAVWLVCACIGIAVGQLAIMVGILAFMLDFYLTGV